MTTLNPSHNVFRQSEGRHAQAVYRASEASSSTPPEGSDFEDDLSVDDRVERVRAARRGRKEGRQRVRRAMPPMPDLRFEQSYLLSIRPYLHPRPTPVGLSEKGPTPASRDSKTLVTSSDEDAVFHWGRQVDVDWKMVLYVTIRDQFFSPLIQGALWGWGTLLLVSTSAAIRSALYPASHVPRGRMTGGPGGSIRESRGLMGSLGDEAETGAGGDGWWRRFVKSWMGGVEAATV